MNRQYREHLKALKELFDKTAEKFAAEKGLTHEEIHNMTQDLLRNKKSTVKKA